MACCRRLLMVLVLLGFTAGPSSAQLDLAAIDAHADAAPAKVESSVQALALYLGNAGETELERARAVYRWLTMNVDYDVEGFRTGDYGDLSPDGVLHSRRAVCSGYAGLAKALGEAMGLEIEVVNGWSKGYGYTAGQTFDGVTNHAWNAVRIDGDWRLMDPTWGAGYLDASMRFNRRFQEHYFLTEPETFIFDHLPQDPSWQLLKPVVSNAEYAELVYLRPPFFTHGLEIRSHDRIRIEAGDRVQVTLGARDGVLLLAQVQDANGRELERSRAFTQVGNGEARIDAVFPAPGSYVVRIFAKHRDDEGAYSWALDYRVEASAGDPDGGFPTSFSSFRDHDIVLHEPMQGSLAAGETHHFRLVAPGALQVAIVAGGEWTYLEHAGDDVYQADVMPSAGELTVYAKYDEDAQFTGLLQYSVH